MTNSSENNDSSQLRIRRGRVDSVDLYEIKDSELELLEKGAPAEIQLNFAIFLISIAFASFTCLVTATFKEAIFQTTYIIVTFVGAILGLYFLIIWWKTRKSISKIVKKIRDRIPIELPTTSPSPKTTVSESGKKCEDPAG